MKNLNWKTLNAYLYEFLDLRLFQKLCLSKSIHADYFN